MVDTGSSFNLIQLRSDSTGGHESETKADSQIPVEDVKAEWTLLWRNRIDDKLRAEGIAKKDYSLLFVDQGTVIVATKDFKPLNIKEILKSHQIQNNEIRQSPHPSVGGYRHFAKTVLNKQTRATQWKANDSPKSNKPAKVQQKKKGGRGWLHQ